LRVIQVAINLTHYCNRHLPADANRLRMCDCNFGLVIDFDALIGK
jgi:hypothetical protein